jgi:hypothetical protein
LQTPRQLIGSRNFKHHEPVKGGEQSTCQIHNPAYENVEEEKQVLQAIVFALLLEQVLPCLQWLEFLQELEPVDATCG